MKTELKKKWVEKLRSGEYKQTTQFLKTSNGYCCLGVLCDILGSKWEIGDFVYHENPETVYINEDGHDSFPSKEICEMINNDEDEVNVDELIQMNDSGKSFAEIADWIEKHVNEESGSNAAGLS